MAAAEMLTDLVRSSAYIRYRDGTQHVEDILDNLHPAIINAYAIWMSVAHKEHQKVLCTRPTTKF